MQNRIPRGIYVCSHLTALARAVPHAIRTYRPVACTCLIQILIEWEFHWLFSCPIFLEEFSSKKFSYLTSMCVMKRRERKISVIHLDPGTILLALFTLEVYSFFFLFFLDLIELKNMIQT